MKRILITGASGFLGRHLLNAAPDNSKVLAQCYSQPLHIPGAQAIQLDLGILEFEIIKAFRPDVIIHAAANSNVGSCEQSRDATWQINVIATEKLVDLAKEINARFIFTSTDLVFDGKKGNYRENDAPNPINVYGESKLAAEKYILSNHKNAVIARSALIFGKSLHGKPTFNEQMIMNLKNGNPVRLFTDEYRTPVSVQELAQALWELAENDFKGTLHLGGSQRLSRYEMGEIVCEHFGFSKSLLIAAEMQKLTLAAKRPPDCSFDISLANSVLNTELNGFGKLLGCGDSKR